MTKGYKKAMIAHIAALEKEIKDNSLYAKREREDIAIAKARLKANNLAQSIAKQRLSDAKKVIRKS